MKVTISALLVTGIIFILGMFLSYRDALRKKKPEGLLSAFYGLILKPLGWNPEPKTKAMRGYVFGQNFLIRLISAFIFVICVKLCWWLGTGALGLESYSTSGGVSTRWMIIHLVAALASMYLFDLWPSVRKKTFERAENFANSGKEHFQENMAGIKAKTESFRKRFQKEKPQEETKTNVQPQETKKKSLEDIDTSNLDKYQ
ncbi:MAG: hypothetical protein MRY57_00230 [Candidatus Pacebacteria bacterium]|nr:hypothetical protein [Candidatus Paceibacterota bacterium]